MTVWFVRENAPQWSVGSPIAFVDDAQQVADFREMTVGDLRVCVPRFTRTSRSEGLSHF